MQLPPMAGEAPLSAAAHAEVFRSAVAGPALRRTEASSAPTAFFLGGQPGSGKSTFARTFTTLFGSNNFVHVDVDRLRPLHPAYLPMMADPATELLAPTAVQRDCSRWADQLRDVAISERRHMLVENTMRSPDQVRETAHGLRNAGYKTEARLLAVHPITSEIALLNRYEMEKRTLGFGREMPVEYHNLAASGLVETVAAIEAEQLIDHLTIVDRAGNIVYDNQLVDGQWMSHPQGAAAMEACRTASLDVAERRNVLRIWNEVLDMMERRSATVDAIAAIEARRDSTQRAIASIGRCGFPGAGAGPSRDSLNLHGHGSRTHFHGKVLEVNALQVVQKIGRDPDLVARHDINKLSRVPSVGEVVDVRYANNSAHVSEKAPGQALRR